MLSAQQWSSHKHEASCLCSHCNTITRRAIRCLLSPKKLHYQHEPSRECRSFGYGHVLSKKVATWHKKLSLNPSWIRSLWDMTFTPIDRYVAQADMEAADGCTGKYTVGLGQTNMAFTDDTEDIASIFMTVTRQLMNKYLISPNDIVIDFFPNSYEICVYNHSLMYLHLLRVVWRLARRLWSINPSPWRLVSCLSSRTIRTLKASLRWMHVMEALLPFSTASHGWNLANGMES